MYRSLKTGSLKDALIGGMAVILIGFLAFRFYAAGLYEPSVIQRGSVAAYGRTDRTVKVTAQVRLVQVGRRSFWQVEVSSGNWQDCGMDCAAVLRRFAFPE